MALEQTGLEPVYVHSYGSPKHSVIEGLHCIYMNFYLFFAIFPDVDECALGLSQCENGGTCLNTIGGYECVCPPGYTGPYCAADINECLDNPCLNGGTCINNFGSYVCNCPPNYSGKNCEFGVETAFRYSLPTLNLTYTPDLGFNTSRKFQEHARLFCDDVSELQ